MPETVIIYCYIEINNKYVRWWCPWGAPAKRRPLPLVWVPSKVPVVVTKSSQYFNKIRPLCSICQAIISPWAFKIWILFLLLCMQYNTFFPKRCLSALLLQSPSSMVKHWAGRVGPTPSGWLQHQQLHLSLLAGWKPLHEGLWPVAFTKSYTVKLQETPQDKAPAKFTYSRNIFFI